MQVARIEIRPWCEAARRALEPSAHGPFVDLVPLLTGAAETEPDGRELWAAWQSDGCVGLIVLDPTPDGQVELTLSVVEEQRRCGLGSRLLDFARGLCRPRCQPLFALVDERNLAACRFFERHAFRREASGIDGHARYVE